ncbi:MAG: hypothetical protein Q6353_016035, partial [Candidatus Sigynarchaeum springense]
MNAKDGLCYYDSGFGISDNLDTDVYIINPDTTGVTSTHMGHLRLIGNENGVPKLFCDGIASFCSSIQTDGPDQANKTRLDADQIYFCNAGNPEDDQNFEIQNSEVNVKYSIFCAPSHGHVFRAKKSIVNAGFLDTGGMSKPNDPDREPYTPPPSNSIRLVAEPIIEDSEINALLMVDEFSELTIIGSKIMVLFSGMGIVKSIDSASTIGLLVPVIYVKGDSEKTKSFAIKPGTQIDPNKNGKKYDITVNGQPTQEDTTFPLDSGDCLVIDLPAGSSANVIKRQSMIFFRNANEMVIESCKDDWSLFNISPSDDMNSLQIIDSEMSYLLYDLSAGKTDVVNCEFTSCEFLLDTIKASPYSWASFNKNIIAQGFGFCKMIGFRYDGLPPTTFANCWFDSQFSFQYGSQGSSFMEYSGSTASRAVTLVDCNFDSAGDV